MTKSTKIYRPGDNRQESVELPFSIPFRPKHIAHICFISFCCRKHLHITYKLWSAVGMQGECLALRIRRIFESTSLLGTAHSSTSGRPHILSLRLVLHFHCTLHRDSWQWPVEYHGTLPQGVHIERRSWDWRGFPKWSPLTYVQIHVGPIRACGFATAWACPSDGSWGNINSIFKNKSGFSRIEIQIKNWLELISKSSFKSNVDFQKSKVNFQNVHMLL